jgi:DNA-binding transcriptional regulator YdaS (Cro superfamily)
MTTLATLTETERRAVIRRAAELVGGGHALARALDVTPRTVQMWLAGDRGIKDGVMADLAQALRTHGDHCHGLADLIPPR